MLSLRTILLQAAALCVASWSVVAQSAGSEKLLLAHYMPWCASRQVSGRWGWHWTMRHFDPEQVLWDGNRRIASHDYPLIGP